MTADGEVMEKAAAEAAGKAITGEREVSVVSVKRCLLSANDVLSQDTWGKYIPLVPVYGEEIFDEGRSKYFSLVTHAKDPQRRYNYWLTASTEIIALQPRSPFVGVTGNLRAAP